MPVLSMFYGLIVTMYYLDTKQHNYPYIPVKYGEHEMIFRIPNGDALESSLPPGKVKLVKAMD